MKLKVYNKNIEYLTLEIRTQKVRTIGLPELINQLTDLLLKFKRGD